MGADGTLDSYNLFAYCDNNAVNRTDYNGNLSLSNKQKVLIGVLATAAAIALTISSGGAAAPILLAVSVCTVEGAVNGFRHGGVEGMKDGAANAFMWGGIGAFVGSAATAIKGACEELRSIKGGSSSNLLEDKTPKELSNMSREELERNAPEGWDFQNHNGRIHIKDANGNFRIRIDPPDKVTNYTHMHVYDEFGNSLDEFGAIVSPKSPFGHLPYDH